MKDCIFCKIAKRELKADIVFENKTVMAFKDLNPQAPLHILIVPKKHVAGMNFIDEDSKGIVGDMLLAAKELAKLNGVSESGYRIVANSGPDAGQTVDHLHFHMLGGRMFKWPPG